MKRIFTQKVTYAKVQISVFVKKITYKSQVSPCTSNSSLPYQRAARCEHSAEHINHTCREPTGDGSLDGLGAQTTIIENNHKLEFQFKVEDTRKVS